MSKILTISIAVLLLSHSYLWGQVEFRVMSYNVENLFDTTDNPLTADDEFLPSGNRNWSHARFYHKLQQIAKVITAAGEWSTPALVALCEVENDSILHRLLHHTPLKEQAYRYCMTHGQDTRGINCALLYQRDKFRYQGHREHPVRFAHRANKPTRNILHVWGEVITQERLDVFVCHFPSRYGGEKESEQERFAAATTLRTLCDSLHTLHPNAHILILGDFNDTPEKLSIREKMGAYPILFPCPENLNSLPREIKFSAQPVLKLYNLLPPAKSTPAGTHKYQGEWNQLDQIIISASLADTTAAFHYLPSSTRIFAPPFLLTPDKTWRGERPHRSFYGFKYEGGYIDHLPIIAEFLLLK